MRKLTIIFTVFAILAISSCEGFLDVEPGNSRDSETSIQNVDDAKVFLNGLFRSMASYVYYGRNFLLYGDAKGGDFTLRSQGRGNDQLYVFNHSATSSNYGSYWNHLYYCILQTNNLVNNIEAIKESGELSVNEEKAIDNYLGQALTARALIYFDLVRLYGKPYNMDKTSLGVPLELEALDAKAQPLRATVEEIYTQILKDLSDAAPIITKDANTAATRGFMTYWVNRAVLARVALHMDDFATALTAAEEIIDSGKFTLYTPEQWVSSWGVEHGSESIFELGVYPGEADNTTGSLGYYLLRRDQLTGALGFFAASDYFLDRLGQDDDDVRWGVMMPDESNSSADIAANAPGLRLGSMNKYAGGPAMAGDKDKLSATNVKVIRLSEIYLIAAEAALKHPTPNKTKAAGYLQEIRERSPNLAPATAGNVTMEMVEDERSKELFGEGHRYFDMLRWNKSITFNDEFIFPVVEITHREKTIDRTFYKAILPIPDEEINANPPIGAQQNPGY